MRITASIVALLFLASTKPAAIVAAAGTSGLAGASLVVADASISVSCPLTVGGRFEAKTTTLQGQLVLDPTLDGAVSGQLSADLATLQTGIRLRDEHMRQKYLEVQRGQQFEFAVLDDIRLDGINALDPAGKVTFTGVLALHGSERPVSGTAAIRRSDSDLRVQASFPVRISDFAISTPRYLGVGVDDDVVVTVSFRLKS